MGNCAGWSQPQDPGDKTALPGNPVSSTIEPIPSIGADQPSSSSVAVTGGRQESTQTASATAGGGRLFIALYDYDARTDEDLSFRQALKQDFVNCHFIK